MAPPVFPSLPGITFPVKRGVKWAGSRHEALSGKRVSTSYYTYPTYSYEVVFNVLRSATAFLEWQQLAGFINSLAGSAGLFLYNDVNDNIVSQQLFGTGDGNSTTFQLVRTLGNFTEPVFFPDLVNGAVTQVTVGGVATGAYTVSATGQIVFMVAPALGAALAWTGTYKWPCRFDDAEYGFENFMTKLWELRSLKFSSEKLV